MGAFLLFLFFMCFFGKWLEEYGPDLLEALGVLCRFLFLCIGITLKLLWRLARWLVIAIFRLSCAGARAAFLFARIFIEEWRRPAGDADESVDEPTAAAADPYADALARFGLRPGFSREELNRAYKGAIQRVHPDRGGSTEAATQVNVARDVIRARMGWA